MMQAETRYLIRSVTLWGLILTLIVSVSAHAEDEDNLLLMPKLSVDQAELIAETCVGKFKTSGASSIAIFVFDAAGVPLAFRRMDGVAAGIIEVARAKAKGAALYGFKTREMRNWAATNSSVIVVPGFNGTTGGVPIKTGSGILLGGVGVSGAASDDDEACALDGIKAIEGILAKF